MEMFLYGNVMKRDGLSANERYKIPFVDLEADDIAMSIIKQIRLSVLLMIKK